MGHPIPDGIPLWGYRHFFLGLLPPPKMAVPEGKRSEVNLALAFYEDLVDSLQNKFFSPLWPFLTELRLFFFFFWLKWYPKNPIPEAYHNEGDLALVFWENRLTDTRYKSPEQVYFFPIRPFSPQAVFSCKYSSKIHTRRPNKNEGNLALDWYFTKKPSHR